MKIDKDGNWNLHVKVSEKKHPEVIEAGKYLEKNCIDVSKFTRKAVAEAVEALKGGKK